MPRKKKPPLSFVDRMKRLAASGLGDSGDENLASSRSIGPDSSNGSVVTGTNTNSEVSDVLDAVSEDMLLPLEERVKKVLGIAERNRTNLNRMLFFVMYDIECDKVRRLVCKYLIREGCMRVQKSIFLADRPIEVYERIRTDLAEVQAVYDNEDSIIVLPVTSDYLKMMKIIGKNVNVDIITHSKNTLFF